LKNTTTQQGGINISMHSKNLAGCDVKEQIEMLHQYQN